jgi:hypothetical protein
MLEDVCSLYANITLYTRLEHPGYWNEESGEEVLEQIPQPIPSHSTVLLPNVKGAFPLHSVIFPV